MNIKELQQNQIEVLSKTQNNQGFLRSLGLIKNIKLRIDDSTEVANEND